MNTLQISLFGKFSIKSDRPIPSGLFTRRVQELFSYLLLNRGRSHSRETLASLLWGDSRTAQSKKNLRQILWHLQAALGSLGAPGDSRVLQVELDSVQLNLESEIWLDVDVFERAFTLARGVPGRELDAHRCQTVQSAVQLYQSDLLEDWYHDWCLFERERLQNMYVIMLDKLMEYCEANGEYEAGVSYGSRILRRDRARERTHRSLMRLYYLAGDRTGALRQYQKCLAALNEELGVPPAKRTLALYDQIRADQLHDPDPVPSTAALDTPTPTLHEVIDRLRQLHAALTNMQRQVHHDIQIVELALRS